MKNNGNESVLIPHILDLQKRTDNRNVICSSSFLSEDEQNEVIKNVKADNMFFFGGFDGSERKCCGFLTDYYAFDDISSDASLCGISFCRISFSSFDKSAIISHRDVLGSLMALGIERDSIGDIVIKDGIVEIAVLSSIISFIVENLKTISRYTVKVENVKTPSLAINQEFIEKKISVVSYRADALISAVFNLSRTISSDAITEGLVQINGSVFIKPDKQISLPCKLAFKGKGKAIIEETDSFSKKGRTFILVKYYK